MPSFTGGRADFPLFPQAVCLLGSGKDNRWAGLPEKAQSVVPPRTGYRERMSEQRKARSGSKEWESPWQPLPRFPLTTTS